MRNGGAEGMGVQKYREERNRKLQVRLHAREQRVYDSSRERAQGRVEKS